MSETAIQSCIKKIWRIFTNANRLFGIIDNDKNLLKPNLLFGMSVEKNEIYEEWKRIQMENFIKLKKKWEQHGYDTDVNAIKTALECIEFPSSSNGFNLLGFENYLNRKFTDKIIAASEESVPNNIKLFRFVQKLEDIDAYLKERIDEAESVAGTVRRAAGKAADAVADAYRRLAYRRLENRQAWHAIAKLLEITERISIAKHGHG